MAHTGPETNHLADTIVVDGRQTDVVSIEGVPIGPTWSGEFFLGADGNGRDVMVRLLYAGRTSLLIGLTASAATILAAVVVGLLAGYMRGWTDAVLSRVLDVLWAFPVILLGVALGTALALGGLKVGPLTIAPGSELIPILVIALVYVPYLARPLRGQVLALREREFVEAARAGGAGAARVMFREILPNLTSTITVFLPLLVANAILLEAALSFLGAGVQPPTASWGTMIEDGVARIATAPHLAIVPGAMLVVAVLALNALAEGVRAALEPRATPRLAR